MRFLVKVAFLFAITYLIIGRKFHTLSACLDSYNTTCGGFCLTAFNGEIMGHTFWADKMAIDCWFGHTVTCNSRFFWTRPFVTSSIFFTRVQGITKMANSFTTAFSLFIRLGLNLVKLSLTRRRYRTGRPCPPTALIISPSITLISLTLTVAAIP